MWNHRNKGPTINYTWIFNCAGVSASNLCIAQGSTVHPKEVRGEDLFTATYLKKKDVCVCVCVCREREN